MLIPREKGNALKAPDDLGLYFFVDVSTLTFLKSVKFPLQALTQTPRRERCSSVKSQFP